MKGKTKMKHLLVETHSENPTLALDMNFKFVDFNGKETEYRLGTISNTTNDVRERLFADSDEDATTWAMASLSCLERKGDITYAQIQNIETFEVFACLHDDNDNIYGLKHIIGNMYEQAEAA